MNCFGGIGWNGIDRACVLVHGAWHGAWCWDMVAPHLAEAGLNVIAVELPGHGRDYAPIGRQDLETMQNTWKLS